ncbi:MAG TPA: ATP-binding protein [Ferruginibacter sp.]|nr:ATP-binding protein [Ferruginibacter sp.]HRE63163.1 ATP-binding protein [Ferruginibacter sp.]
MKDTIIRMRLLFIALFFISAYNTDLYAQPSPFDQKFVDSISPILSHLKDDSIKVKHLVKLASMYINQDPELTLKYAKEGVIISKKINYPNGIIGSLGQSAFFYAITGEWAKAARDVNEAIPICEKYNPRALIYMYNILFISSTTKGDTTLAMNYVQKAYRNPLFNTMEEIAKWPTYMQLGIAYVSSNNLDSAEYFANINYKLTMKYGKLSPDLANNTFQILGDIALKKAKYEEALKNYRLAGSKGGMAAVYIHLNQQDSVIFYAFQGLEEAERIKNPRSIQMFSTILATAYETSDPGKSNIYLQKYIKATEAIYNYNKLKQLEELSLARQQEEFEIQKKTINTRNRYLFLVFSAVILSLIILLTFLWRNNKFRQRVNKQLEDSFAKLKSTQSQLLQSEKMASLGELTAGIAHEIQNPLNFVNNFSEVSTELVDEMNEEIEKGNLEDAREIANDLKQNLEKITHHGKRAGEIVKGMLQHSRKSEGKKEPTDINALCDEYLRLAYHGLRAKDKSFNAEMKTGFDETIGNINVVPQDIGRVILNLITNAFYAVNEKKKTADEIYNPLVSLHTKKLGNKIEICVSDNGNGIPEAIKDKIFQPFFTTKPTGSGTGLGLSLSYDIVKAHGGDLEVETKEGEGTAFIIQLPFK